MKPLPTFEDRLAEWLEDAPADAPDVVIKTVLAAFPSIPQRRGALRVPWRFPLMNRYAPALIGIAAVAVVAVVGLTLINRPQPAPIGGLPSPSTSPSVAPTVTPTPAPTTINTSTWSPFTSVRHGVTLRRPSDWTATAATAPWPPGTDAPNPPNPVLDVLTSPLGNGTSFVIVSQALPKGVTGDAWLATHEQIGGTQFPNGCWAAPAQMESITVGGQQGWIHGGLDQCGFTEAIVFAGGRLYELTGYTPPGFNSTFDRALFDTFLSTVQFDPTKANDRPTASASPRPS